MMFPLETAKIHPTSIIHPKALIGKNVTIGPFNVIGADIQIGDNCVIHSHCVFDGIVKIGTNNVFYSYCSIGAPPQDTGYKGEPTQVLIGNNNIFREYVSIHRGTTKQDCITKLGDECLVMAYAHIGHDVNVGNRVRITNAVNLAGHVNIGDHTIINGATNIAQFVTLGTASYIGGASAVDRDIPPYCTAVGNRIRLKGINIIGMRRMGFSKQDITEVVDFFKSIESSSVSPRTFVQHHELMVEYEKNAIIKEMAKFIKDTPIGIAPFA